MVRRIGYLCSEFPGQTHLFLWREIAALKEFGVECELVATRRAPPATCCHSWAAEAEKRTTYLAPFGPRDIIEAVVTILAAGPVRWLRCLDAIWAPDLKLAERARLMMLLLPAAKLARIVRRKDLNHVHVTICADAANTAMLASMITDMTYSLSLLGPVDNFGPNQKNKWAHSRFGIVMSKVLADELSSRLGDRTPKLIRIAPLGVDLTTMTRSAPYHPWQQGEACRVYTCGRLNPVKGHADLIDAVCALRTRGLPIELRIAGEDEHGGTGYRKELERHISTQNAEGFVALLGAVSEQVHRAELERAHVFALASYSEGVSVALMEAMAMQTPVVATRVGGHDELIDDGTDGTLLPAGEPDQLADALETLLRDPSLAMMRSSASREKISRKFDSRSSGRILAECLEATATETSHTNAA